MDTHLSKRQRIDGNTEVDATVASKEKQIVRDETYYQETGDCVILVDTVLFKIHRFLLERDASAFSNMFSLPQDSANSQTNSDGNPLVLYDDVDDFQALFWIMYALPTEQSQQHTLHTADIQKLVSLYLISHKYHYEAHETFARDLLSKHCLALISEPSSNYNYFNKCAESRLQTILQIAVLTEQASQPLPLSSGLQDIWTNRLKKTSGPISFALGVGEALGLRNFMAKLYYLELTRMNPVPLLGSMAYTHPISDLAPHHMEALYRGNWSLRYYWLKIRQISSKQNDFDCMDFDINHSCPEVWSECWDGVGGDEWNKPFDPLKELLKVQTEIQYTSHAHCAERRIRSMIDNLKDSLADHFFGYV